ncbi:MAG: peptidoglycan editing factor PgeF [Oscillospiraceae bacterium]|nr:peptidoglycan editing factor PgeF [Oscillospiraceae bacterium]
MFFSQKLPREAEERERALSRLCPGKLCLAGQVHGETILYADHNYTARAGDALYTDLPGVFVGVKTADCVPVLLTSRAAAAAVHAGWRGTARRIAEKTARLLCETYRLSPEEITAHIGPCICQTCYETDGEVAEALGPEAAAYIARRGAKFHPDLRAVNAHWLRNMGLRDIRVSPDCTRCLADVYWSHRAHGSGRGVQVSWAGDG